MRSADTDVDDEGSLYDQVVDATGIEYNTATDAEDYKNTLVRYFGNMSEDDFDALSDELRDWVNEATAVFNANRRAKEREALPDIEGMPTPPPPRTRRARVSLSDDEEEDIPAPPPARRPRVVAAPPEEEPEEPEEPEEEAEPEEEPEEEAAPPPRRATRTRTSVKAAKPAAAAKVTRHRDPDSGRYAKVMPHYLKHRDILVPELQARIEKVGGDVYSEMTLDRTLAACRAVVAWAERNGVDFAPAMRK